MLTFNLLVWSDITFAKSLDSLVNLFFLPQRSNWEETWGIQDQLFEGYWCFISPE